MAINSFFYLVFISDRYSLCMVTDRGSVITNMIYSKLLKVITDWLLHISWVGAILWIFDSYITHVGAAGFLAETLNRFLVISFFLGFRL